MNPLISVIIPTKNSAKTIGACINSITKQSYKNIECIVIDNHSSDATRQIAIHNHAHVIVAGDERSAQRNAGANYAHGDFFLFIDSDMELPVKLIEECITIITNTPHIQALIIPEESFGTTLWAACKRFERSCYAHTTWLQAARFFRKEAFIKIRGFSGQIIGAEDFDIHSKIIMAYGKNAIGSTSETILHNEGELAIGALLRKKYYYGSTLHAYKAQARNKTAFYAQANPITRIMLFFNHPEFLLRHPIIFLATCAMKTLEFCALVLGYLAKRTV